LLVHEPRAFLGQDLCLLLRHAGSREPLDEGVGIEDRACHGHNLISAGRRGKQQRAKLGAVDRPPLAAVGTTPPHHRQALMRRRYLSE
jgi:hypothetical protein